MGTAALSPWMLYCFPNPSQEELFLSAVMAMAVCSLLAGLDHSNASDYVFACFFLICTSTFLKYDRGTWASGAGLEEVRLLEFNGIILSVLPAPCWLYCPALIDCTAWPFQDPLVGWHRHHGHADGAGAVMAPRQGGAHPAARGARPHRRRVGRGGSHGLPGGRVPKVRRPDDGVYRLGCRSFIRDSVPVFLNLGCYQTIRDLNSYCLTN